MTCTNPTGRRRAIPLAALLFVALLGVPSCRTTASTPETSPMESTRSPAPGGPGHWTPPPPTPADQLLLEMRISSHHGQGSGYRILLDGRYETYGGVAAEDGGWWLLRQMSGDELAAFRAQMDALDLAALQDEYAPAQPVADGGSTTWRLRLGDEIRTVKVRQGADVPPLQALYDGLPEQVVATSDVVEWTVLRGGSEQTHAITAEECAPLDAITWEMAIKGEERAEGGPGDGAQRVLNIEWKAGGVVGSSQELWSDGWQLIRVAGQVDTRKQHSGDETSALRRMLDALDWAAIEASCR